MKKRNRTLQFLVIILIFISARTELRAQTLKQDQALDEKVKSFLNENSRRWYDMNVPEADGRAMYDIILKNGYKDALEIGTSTGYSTIWIAWALSKTGGKVITVEIDKQRYEEALAHFREAGLDKYIDARLGEGRPGPPGAQPRSRSRGSRPGAPSLDRAR